MTGPTSLVWTHSSELEDGYRIPAGSTVSFTNLAGDEVLQFQAQTDFRFPIETGNFQFFEAVLKAVVNQKLGVRHNLSNLKLLTHDGKIIPGKIYMCSGSLRSAGTQCCQ